MFCEWSFAEHKYEKNTFGLHVKLGIGILYGRILRFK